MDAGHLLVAEAAVAAALRVALQDDVQAGQKDDGQQAGADVPLPAAEADDRAVGEDRVVDDAGDAVGEEVARGEAAGAAGEPVLGLGVLVPPGLRVGEATARARSDPLATWPRATDMGDMANARRPVRRSGMPGGTPLYAMGCSSMPELSLSISVLRCIEVPTPGIR